MAGLRNVLSRFDNSSTLFLHVLSLSLLNCINDGHGELVNYTVSQTIRDVLDLCTATSGSSIPKCITSIWDRIRRSTTTSSTHPDGTFRR